METSGINQVNFNGRVTARVIDRAGVDLGDSHDVCSNNKLDGRRRIFEVFKGVGVKSKRNLVSWWVSLADGVSFGGALFGGVDHRRPAAG